MSSRRGFLKGMLALAAAPAIVRVASIMPIKPIDIIGMDFGYDECTVICGHFLTITQITREAVRLWKNSNQFLTAIEAQYTPTFQAGSKLRIRLPNNFTLAAK